MNKDYEILLRRAENNPCDGDCDLNPPYMLCSGCKATQALNDATTLFRLALTLTKRDASLASLHNRSQIKEGVPCACYFCMQIIDGSEIEDWADDGDTALCPRCNIDAIVPNESNITYLQHAHRASFYSKVKEE